MLICESDVTVNVNLPPGDLAVWKECSGLVVQEDVRALPIYHVVVVLCIWASNCSMTATSG